MTPQTRTWLGWSGALALSLTTAQPAPAQQPTPPPTGELPVGPTPPPLQLPPGGDTAMQIPVSTPPTPADLPQPDPTPTPAVVAGPPTGQIYPVPPFRETDVPFSPERRVDLVSKQARAEATRVLTAQEQEGVRMTDDWAAKSAQFQIQSAVNGSVVLTFNSSLPALTAAVLELTDVELQPGEAVTSVNIGDTARWVIAVTNSQEGE